MKFATTAVLFLVLGPLVEAHWVRTGQKVREDDTLDERHHEGSHHEPRAHEGSHHKPRAHGEAEERYYDYPTYSPNDIEHYYDYQPDYQTYPPNYPTWAPYDDDDDDYSGRYDHHKPRAHGEDQAAEERYYDYGYGSAYPTWAPYDDDDYSGSSDEEHYYDYQPDYPTYSPNYQVDEVPRAHEAHYKPRAREAPHRPRAHEAHHQVPRAHEAHHKPRAHGEDQAAEERYYDYGYGSAYPTWAPYDWSGRSGILHTEQRAYGDNEGKHTAEDGRSEEADHQPRAHEAHHKPRAAHGSVEERYYEEHHGPH